MPAKEKALQHQAPVNDFVNMENIDQFNKTERLSKRLARMGVCSRRQAEVMIARRMIKVDGQVVESNVPVTSTNLVQVGAKTGMYTPIKENTRVWLFNKP
jgi:23S rRNA pseudouridine2605 synthase